jgi:dephospho-CoA kinase
MLLIGLTGGIASGKTVVSKMFVKLGAYLIDADVIARDIVKPFTPAWEDIALAFGRPIIDENNEINREVLGRIIFNNPEKRKQLEAITHHRIIDEENHQVRVLKKKYNSGIIIIDAALLIEAGRHNRVDKLLVVYADRKTQLKRLMVRDKLNKAEAQKRLDSQMSLDEKVKMADFVIDNSKTMGAVESQVADIYSSLMKTA